MVVQLLGCSYRTAPLAIRERLAFSREQIKSALSRWRSSFPEAEAVLLSTCNRVELYVATETSTPVDANRLAGFLGQFHQLDPAEILQHAYELAGRDAVRHLFTVASSLDSMVLGEPQILAQVKEAYDLATAEDSTGPLTHAAFQAAVKVARRIATETSIHRRRVSIPSVAVGDFASQIFERFDDKQILVIGAGEMGEETLRYLRDEGARHIVVVNRSLERARRLAERWNGQVQPWERLLQCLAEADLVVSTTGAEEPIVTAEQFRVVEQQRGQRPLFILDLAVPRDFEEAIGERPGVYLYAVDDLRAACERNRREREKELPKAMKIIEEETDNFMAELYHRATSPIIRRLREQWHESKEKELTRLFNKLPDLDDRAREEIRHSFDRLVNKLLHPPLSSLRHEARAGIPHRLVEALVKLFQLQD